VVIVSPNTKHVTELVTLQAHQSSKLPSSCAVLSSSIYFLLINFEEQDLTWADTECRMNAGYKWEILERVSLEGHPGQVRNRKNSTNVATWQVPVGGRQTLTFLVLGGHSSQ